MIRRVGGLLVHHERVDDIFASAIGNEGYVLRSPELAPLLEAALEIQAVAALD